MQVRNANTSCMSIEWWCGGGRADGDIVESLGPATHYEVEMAKNAINDGLHPQCYRRSTFFKWLYSAADVATTAKVD